MPLPATDTFVGAAGALAGSWTQQLLNPAVTLNRDGSGHATPSAFGTLDTTAWWNADTFPADQYSQLVVVVSGNGSIEALVRASGAVAASDNCYIFYISGTAGCGFEKYLNGTVTALGTNATNNAVSDIIRLEVIGNVLTAKKNGAFIANQIDASIATGSAGIGIFVGTGTLPSITTWEGGAIVPTPCNEPSVIIQQRRG